MRDNLRIATQLQSQQNRRKRRNNTSGFKGVSWSKKDRRWIAMIRNAGKRIYLGSRKTPDAAWRELYLPAAIKYYGEFARFA